jgi:SNF2 family DNA or RNA helicase
MDFFLSKLNDSQREVIDEVHSRSMINGGLALPLGFGKTRIGLTLGLTYNKGKVLVVVSKTLLASWLDELKKIFGQDDEDKTCYYEVLHRSFFKSAHDYNHWVPKKETRIVLTTPEVLSEGYDTFHLSDRLLFKVTPDGEFGPTHLRYRPAGKIPFLTDHTGFGFPFSYTWGCVLIDEIQRHTNVETEKCRAIACVASHHKWGLSGTMFDEPKVNRFLGFFVMLDLPGPRQKTEVAKFLTQKNFSGFRLLSVFRKENVEFVDRPDYNEVIVKHNLTEEEQAVFEKFRFIVNELNRMMVEARAMGQTTEKKRLSANLLAIITYLRQALVCPIIPISRMCRDVDAQEQSDLMRVALGAFSDKPLADYTKAECYIFSSRFREITEKLKLHQKERCIVFSGFRATLDALMPFAKNLKDADDADRQVLTITAVMTVEQRQDVLKKFALSVNAILMITYDIGAEGLNLQCASVVMLMDLWWNSAKLQQAIGRIYRPGQLASKVFVYMFISNTGLEQQILAKNTIKAAILSQLQCGAIDKLTVPRMSIQDIISFINLDENESSMKELRMKRKIRHEEEEDVVMVV